MGNSGIRGSCNYITYSNHLIMNVTCTSETCDYVLNSKCVFYEGMALPYAGINTNDSLETALQKINEAIQDITVSASVEWGDITGLLGNQADLIAYFNNFTPTTRNLTINGVTYDLSADRSWTVGGGDMVLAATQTNTGAKTFENSTLLLNNPAQTFAYRFQSSAIAAQRNVTLPLLTSDDVFMFQSNNATISGLKSFVDGSLLIHNPALSFSYTLRSSAIAGNRDITLPLLTSNDTFVTANFSQALTNKSVNGVTLTTGGGTTNFLRADGTYAAPSGGGIGGSTGSTDNSILRADGTGGATLQNSGLIIDDSANLTLGSASISGNRTISAVNSTSTADLILTAENVTYINVGVATSTIIQDTDHLIYLAPYTGIGVEKRTVSANPLFSYSSAQGISGATSGQDLLLQSGGGHTSGNTNGGQLYIKAGNKNGSGLDGNIGLHTPSVSNWQGMERGMYVGNILTAPTTGLANGMALYAEDDNSSSELYVTTESGAKVNISGLLKPTTESGTSFSLSETHRNKAVKCTNAGVVTVTIPSGRPEGWNCILIAMHATGTISLTTSGTTIVGATATTTQYETLSLVHLGSEVYLSKLG